MVSLALPAAVSDLELSGLNRTLVLVVAVISIIALVMGVVFRQQVLAANAGTEAMREIGGAVEEGAQAYLARQFKTLGIFVVLVFFLLLVLPAANSGVMWGRSVFFVIGALFSGIIGYMGMKLAVRANVRVASAARDGDEQAGMRIAFRTGGAVGMTTVGLGLLGAAAVVLLFQGDAPAVLEGFGFGAALLAMFMRVGGGIFTKAADVGADLVGKVEAGIPEDDPRNAATIADNVGDNVGDCAGMAADLFESYAVMLVAALILGSVAFGTYGLVFPLLVPAIGAVTALIGVYITKVRQGESALTAINRGFYISAVIAGVLCAIAAYVYLPSSFADLGAAEGSGVAELDGDPRLIAVGAVVIGIVLAGIILWLTGYFTGTDKRPTKDVARTTLTGPATIVLSGIGVGLESAVYTAAIIGGAVYLAFILGGGSTALSLFLVALAGCGLLTTVGVIVAMDTFGPVSDNAQGIAEMSGDVDEAGAQILTDLDAVGNTTKAITKGIAIATAVLAATALFGSYTNAWQTALDGVSGEEQAREAFYNDALGLITSPNILVGLLLGAAVVFLFSGLAINAVTRAAGAIVFEVRRQFREKPGIMDFTEKPDYGRVVDICTRDSLRELATPGLLAVMSPIAVGFGLGVGALAGFLGGAIGAGCLMAVFLANSGGSWDNAKKIIEDGHHGGKGSEAHAAAVIGDTVGDPFKDTAGPAINPLLKVMNLVAVLIAPAVVTLSIGANASAPIRYAIAAFAFAVVVGAVAWSKSKDLAIGGDDHPDAQIATAQFDRLID